LSRKTTRVRGAAARLERLRLDAPAVRAGEPSQLLDGRFESTDPLVKATGQPDENHKRLFEAREAGVIVRPRLCNQDCRGRQARERIKMKST